MTSHPSGRLLSGTDQDRKTQQLCSCRLNHQDSLCHSVEFRHFLAESDKPPSGTLTVGSHHFSLFWTPLSDSSASFETYQNSFWEFAGSYNEHGIKLLQCRRRMKKWGKTPCPGLGNGWKVLPVGDENFFLGYLFL